MTETSHQPLRVFLCHSSNDKPVVRELYQKLRTIDWIQPWLDEEELYPGQDWNLEIEKAVEAADAILICLSNNSITKEGYVQRELRIVLDYADYKPEGTLYIIPVRLENCDPPRRLRPWQYADYFPKEGSERAFQKLLVSLKRRADSLGLKYETVDQVSKPTSPSQAESLTYKTHAVMRDETPYSKSITHQENKIALSNGMEFMRVPAGNFLMGSTREHRAYDSARPQHTVNIPYDYWMARFPVTNEYYNAYVKARKSQLVRVMHPVHDWETKRDHPVIGVRWKDAIEYCQWLNDLFSGEWPLGWILRLPTEAEREKSARGIDGREYPWGSVFDKNNCNISEHFGEGDTTPVGYYSPVGDSPYGCADMAGNVWEWTHSLFKPYPYRADDGREDQKGSGSHVLRGHSFRSFMGFDSPHCAYRNVYDRDFDLFNLAEIGFRLTAAPAIAEVINLW